jgi:hypothetical protein
MPVCHKNQIETGKVIIRDTAGPYPRQIIPPLPRRTIGTPVRRLSGVTIAGPRRIQNKPLGQSGAGGTRSHHGKRRGRTADISMTDKQDGKLAKWLSHQFSNLLMVIHH